MIIYVKLRCGWDLNLGGYVMNKVKELKTKTKKFTIKDLQEFVEKIRTEPIGKYNGGVDPIAKLKSEFKKVQDESK